LSRRRFLSIEDDDAARDLTGQHQRKAFVDLVEAVGAAD
jgi:hypothetical protein